MIILRTRLLPAAILCLAVQVSLPCDAAPSGASAAIAATVSRAAASPPTAVTASQPIYTDAQNAILAGEAVGRAADKRARRENLSKPLPDKFWGETAPPPTVRPFGHAR